MGRTRLASAAKLWKTSLREVSRKVGRTSVWQLKSDPNAQPSEIEGEEDMGEENVEMSGGVYGGSELTSGSFDTSPPTPYGSPSPPSQTGAQSKLNHH